MNSQESYDPHRAAQEKEEFNVSELLSERFLNTLERDPSAKEVVQDVKLRFNEMEMAMRRVFDEMLDSARPHERVRTVEYFAERTMLGYVSLHEDLTSLLDVANITEEDREAILREAEKTRTFYEGHTLLSFYANRRGMEKKNIDSLTKNTEIAALQQSMAKFYLRHPDGLDEVEPRLDAYGKRAFGSEKEYESFKRGVVSLADAHRHLESMGHIVFFPPPRMDAEMAVDLLYVEGDAAHTYDADALAFFSGNYSAEDLARLDPEFLSHVYGAQVKTRHRIEETYADLYEKDLGVSVPLSDVFGALALDKESFDGLDPTVAERATFRSNTTRGVGKEKTLAVMLSCPRIESRSHAYHGREDERVDALDPQKRRIWGDVQEAANFLGNTLFGSTYVFVEHKGKGEDGPRYFDMQ